MITWRTELLFECDICSEQLILDQLDAKTKKGMFAVAKKEGWERGKSNCICPECQDFMGLDIERKGENDGN